MNETTRIVNLYKETYDIYIGRQYNNDLFDYGNPYPVSEYGREQCIKIYRDYFYKRINNLDDDFKENILKLKGKTLGCYCKPKECHGDIIVEYLKELKNHE